MSATALHGLRASKVCSWGGGGGGCTVAESPTRGLSCLSLLRWLPFPLLRVGWEREAHCGGPPTSSSSHAVESVSPPPQEEASVCLSLCQMGPCHLSQWLSSVREYCRCWTLPPPVLEDGGGGPQPLPSRGLWGSAKGGPPSFSLLFSFCFAFESNLWLTEGGALLDSPQNFFCRGS